MTSALQLVIQLLLSKKLNYNDEETVAKNGICECLILTTTCKVHKPLCSVLILTRLAFMYDMMQNIT